MKPTDIRIEDVAFVYEDYLYRTPIKFGGTAVDRVTLVNVECHVHTLSGRAARGFGSMPLGNLCAVPSRVLSYDATLPAVETLLAHIPRNTANYRESAHPVDLT